jgi:hypothetical protein
MMKPNHAFPENIKEISAKVFNQQSFSFHK